MDDDTISITPRTKWKWSNIHVWCYIIFYCTATTIILPILFVIIKSERNETKTGLRLEKDWCRQDSDCSMGINHGYLHITVVSSIHHGVHVIQVPIRRVCVYLHWRTRKWRRPRQTVLGRPMAFNKHWKKYIYTYII